MSYITYVLVGLYAVLTGVAGIVQWKEKGFQARTFLFLIISICMLGTLWIPNKMIMFGMLILIFTVFHILAAQEGLKSNGKLTFSHHIVRFVFHMTIVYLVFQFIV